MSDEAIRHALAVRAAHEQELLRKKNVVGVGVGFRRSSGQPTGEVALVVSVTRKLPPRRLSPRDVIPRQLDGVPVDVQEIGPVRALDSTLDNDQPTAYP